MALTCSLLVERLEVERHLQVVTSNTGFASRQVGLCCQCRAFSTHHSTDSEWQRVDSDHRRAYQVLGKVRRLSVLCDFFPVNFVRVFTSASFFFLQIFPVSIELALDGNIMVCGKTNWSKVRFSEASSRELEGGETDKYGV